MAVGTLLEVMDKMEKGTLDFTKNGKCSGCGACCSNYLPLTEKELRDIKRYVKANNIKPVDHFLPLQNAVIDATCPFVENTGTKRCRIYEVRPRICRAFICDPKQQAAVIKGMAGERPRPVFMREEIFGNGNQN